MSSPSEYYVAPLQPPPSRRPPLRDVGILGWLRANLFSSPLNALATVIITSSDRCVTWNFLSWSIHNAQWSVIFNNLRLIANGQYNRQELWRVDLSAAILVFLPGLGTGIWGHVGRSVFLIVAVVVGFLFLIPAIGARIPEPSIYPLVEPQPRPARSGLCGQKGAEDHGQRGPRQYPGRLEGPPVWLY